MQLLEELLQKPTEDVRVKIDEVLQIDAEKFKNNVQLFEKWIQCQGYLPQNCDLKIIENFIRMSKNNLEKAKAKFESTVVCRTKFRDVYENRSIDANSFATTLAHTHYCMLPGYTPDGYRILTVQLVDRDTAHYDLKESLKYISMIGDLQLSNDILAGHVVIIDFTNFTTAHLTKMKLMDAKKTIYLFQNAYPTRVKRIHFVNINPLAEHLAALVKAFFKEKLRKRIMFHKNLDDLEKFVPLDLLPVNFGGKERSSIEICEDWKQFLVEDTEWSQKFDRLKLTGEMPKHKEDLYSFEEFSMEGNFRQLSID